MPTPPPDPVADELRALRAAIETLGDRVERLADDNARLREQLAGSEAARSDLVAQTEHLIHLLGRSREELRARSGDA